MNLTLKLAMFSCAAMTALGATGCQVSNCTETAPDGGTTQKEGCVQLEPTVEYRDARLRTGEQSWTSGHSISITNQNGPLKVALGGEGDERVLFSGVAFTRDTNNDQGAASAKNTLGAMADPAFGGGDSISLVGPGMGVNGYDLTVWIPSDFDAALTVVNDNGTATLYGANGATSTTVTSHDIVATNLQRSINLHSNVGDVTIDGVPSGPGNVVRADLGDIAVSISAGANLAITAKTDVGAVTFPADWSQTVNADKKAGSATLGDGSGALAVSSGNGDVSFFAK